MDNFSCTKFFKDYCRICGFSEGKTADAWTKIITKSERDFNLWLGQNTNAGEEAGADKMVELFAKNLDGFYEALKSNQTIEQKQVAKAYVVSQTT